MAKGNGFVSAMDNLPFIVKLILCIPMLDIVWAIYRVVKAVSKSNLLMLVVGVLWIVPGCAICWLVDLVCVLLYGNVKLTA